jgi:plasmid stabilization system protein ParE
MARQIIWSKLAEQEKQHILEFYAVRNGNWDYSIKVNVLIEDAIDRLLLYPYYGTTTRYENVRMLVVFDFIIFHEIHLDKIMIMSIWDARQNPDKLPTRLG